MPVPSASPIHGYLFGHSLHVVKYLENQNSGRVYDLYAVFFLLSLPGDERKEKGIGEGTTRERGKGGTENEREGGNKKKEREKGPREDENERDRIML